MPDDMAHTEPSQQVSVSGNGAICEFRGSGSIALCEAASSYTIADCHVNLFLLVAPFLDNAVSLTDTVSFAAMSLKQGASVHLRNVTLTGPCSVRSKALLWRRQRRQRSPANGVPAWCTELVDSRLQTLAAR